MNANHYYSIGSTHIVCQDYARSGYTVDGNAYAIVCDGCSSSPDTDVGARIVGLTAEKLVRIGGEIPTGPEIAWLAKEKIVNLGLEPQAMDATLIIALQNDNTVKIRGWGDGFIVSSYGDGLWQYNEYEYDPNYPFYLSYMADTERMKLWRDSGLGLTVRSINQSEINKTTQPEKPEGWSDQILLRPGRVMFIVTDGMSSFEDKSIDSLNKRVDPSRIAEELVKIKVPRGKFIEKRTRRMLRTLEKENIVNTDDFGIAGIVNPAEQDKQK